MPANALRLRKTFPKKRNFHPVRPKFHNRECSNGVFPGWDVSSTSTVCTGFSSGEGNGVGGSSGGLPPQPLQAESRMTVKKAKTHRGTEKNRSAFMEK